MFRKLYQGGSSRKQGPRPAVREPDHEPRREAQVWSCEWPSEDFMVQAGIKEEFDAYVCNAELEGFVSDKCPQYYQQKIFDNSNISVGVKTGGSRVGGPELCI